MTRYAARSLAEYVEERAVALGTPAFVTGSSSQRLREMWCAAKFGLGYERNVAPCEIDIEELNEQREYDFHLCTDGERLPFQVAEVLDEGRRRGDEYRDRTSDEVNQLHNQRSWKDRGYAGRRVIEELHSKHKTYRSGARTIHMLLYINIKAASVPWASIANAAESESKNFASVWLVTQELICCIHGGDRWVGQVGWMMIEDSV